ncbi:MAG: tetratricopeptide repeat protein, partial [Candidatus Aminicenantes bacterium]|nr:tetratricopeptide repeat protein [Candidatus Aminicenantes bacterium]
MKKYKKIAVISIFTLVFIPFSLLLSQSEKALNIFEKNKGSIISFVSLGENKEEISRGTGFVISAGIMATSFHSISQAKSVEGRNFKGKKVKVEGIVATDKNFDIALVKIKSKAPALLFGNSDDAEEGKEIFVIGSNESGEFKVLDGEIHSLLEISPNQKMIATTLATPESFSGAPLIDSNGQVLGMIVFLDRRSKFVLPSNVIKTLPKKSTATKFKDWKPEDYFSTLEGSFLAGRVFLALKDTNNAEKFLKKVTAQKPNDIETYILLASVYINQRNYSSAASTYKKIIELNPSLDSAHLGLGTIYIKMMRWKDAIVSLEKAVELNLDNKEAYFQIGSVYEELKEFDKAAEAYEKYLSLNPENSG